MASGKSDYLEVALLNAVLGGPAFALPPNVYIALSTAAYSDGAMTGEVVGGAYARVAVANTAANFPGATGSAPATKSNAAAFTFPTASGAWGTILSAYVMDAASGGNKLYGGDLGTGKAIAIGDTASFPANSMTFTED